MSGTGSKLGHWYEDTALLEGLLRLLAEEIQWLTWENPSDGDGIDFSYAQGETIFGVQCKHHGEGKWKWSSLEKKGASRSVLGYAAQWLDQSKNHLYILQTDATFPQLQTACDEAREQENIEIWQQMHSKTVKYLQKKWQVDPIKVYDRCCRIRIKLTGQDTFETHYQTVAGQMCDNGDTLLGVLLDQAKKSLRNCLTASYVRLWLRRKNIELRPKVGEPRIGDFLDLRCQNFLGGIDEVRELEYLTRPQTQQILQSVEEGSFITKVYGPPGSGKSEVLAACVEHWRDEGRAVLALRLDRILDDDLTEKLVTDLPAFSGTHPVIVVLDQFDTLTWAGGASHPKTEIVRRFLRQIQGRFKQFRLIVSCRTLDAAQDTQLKQILDAAAKGTEKLCPPYEIQIPAWTPGEVENVLEKAGIAAGDLDPGVLNLAQTPLFLRIVVTFHRSGVKLKGIRSLHDLLDQHWEWTCKEWTKRNQASDAQLALAEVIKIMQDDSLMQVERSRILNRNGLNAVIDTRFLLSRPNEQGREVLSPSHQTFIDAYIARQWGEVRNIEELLEKIGPKDQQSLQTAGTLRLVVPRLRRTSRGQNLLAEVIEHPNLRTMIRVAALRGLAGEETNEKDRETLLRWLNNPDIRNLAVDHLLFGNVPWVSLAESWMNATWKQEPDYRPILSRLLASVSQTWDGVARLVDDWTKDEPGLLQTLSDIFWRDPAIDSDAEFELRLRYEERSRGPNVYFSLPKLFVSHPQRAIRLMAVRLPHAKDDELYGMVARTWHQFPSKNDPSFRQTAQELAFTVWQHLRSWWFNLFKPDIKFRMLQDGVSLLETVGEFIAMSLASACQQETTNWASILKDLPTQLRRIDVWLLLRVGAQVKNKETANAAGRWFLTDPARDFSIMGENPWRLQKEFLTNVAHQIDESLLEEIEKYLLEYRDPWSIEEEQTRYRCLMEYNSRRPNKVGATVYHLLPCLPRRSKLAQNRFGVWEEKFKKVSRLFWDEWDSPRCRSVISAIPDAILSKQNDDWWIERFRQAKGNPSAFPGKIIDDDTVTEFSVEILAIQLRQAAERNPEKYLSLLQRASELPTEARWNLLAGISVPSKSGSQVIQSPINDETLVVQLESLPFMDDPPGGHLVTIVEKRYQAPWTEKTLERLRSLTLVQAVPQEIRKKNYEERDDASDVLNSLPCKALTTLAMVFTTRPPPHTWIFDLLQHLQSHPDPIRRLAVADAALKLHAIDMKLVHEIILSCAQEPRIAAQCYSEICNYLWSSLEFLPEYQEQTKVCLLNMRTSSSDWIQERYGEIVILLTHKGYLESAIAESAVTGSAPIRAGMAKQLSGRLKTLNWKPWEQSLFLRLADDEQQIRNSLMRHSEEANLRGLLEDTAFWQSLVKTQAFRENEGLIRACDRHSKLTSIQTLIDEIVTTDLNQSCADKGRGENLHIGLVARLTEEGQRLRDQDTVKHALDLWDLCLEKGSGAATQRLMNTLSDTPQ